MLVEEDINGGGLGDAGQFQVLRPGVIDYVVARECGIGPGTNRPFDTSAAFGKKPEETVHGIAANPRRKPCILLPGAEISVGRTLVGAYGLSQIRPQKPELEKEGVGILRVYVPIHDIHAPCIVSPILN